MDYRKNDTFGDFSDFSNSVDTSWPNNAFSPGNRVGFTEKSTKTSKNTSVNWRGFDPFRLNHGCTLWGVRFQNCESVWIYRPPGKSGL